MRRTSLTLAVLLLMGLFVANVAVAAEDDLLLQITSPAAEVAPSEAKPDCKDPDFLPWDTPPASPTAAPCGPCSVSVCRGASIGAWCGSGRTCQNAYGNFCATTTLTHECLCWSGPLP